ncbi:hypothetical protein B0E45_14995 [Sinorhizobium sp. A49]|uniref:hypothetical protein n=1 Tax=Sinorhizobium sp. A49 TaxID=1945861 RepID=UPI000985C998|nr:hypothetical protein [Sinorhizobium sp. A49]OOG69912.1 hypothetical protein B0E45_14995 [Sinorhizobium sp. A49]
MTSISGGITGTGPYWTQPQPIYQIELHPSLLREIEGRNDSGAFKGYLVQIFDDVSSPPSGILEIALNPNAKRACAIYEAKRLSRPLSRRSSNAATKPIWFEARTPQQAANIFYQAIVDQAHDI